MDGLQEGSYHFTPIRRTRNVVGKWRIVDIALVPRIVSKQDDALRHRRHFASVVMVVVDKANCSLPHTQLVFLPVRP